VLLRSDGHDTLLSPVPDLLAGAIWPGAYGRVVRNRLIETWTGREGQLQARRGELFRAAVGARRAGDTDASVVWAGQSAGLITSIEAAGELIEQIVRDAERVIRERAELITARDPAVTGLRLVSPTSVGEDPAPHVPELAKDARRAGWI